MRQESTGGNEVSVIIAAYNVASQIGRAVVSAASQTLAPLEILVIDDCSTDQTRSIVGQLSAEYPSVRLIELSKNQGPAHARNAGIAAARGDWLAMLDADDAWNEGRLERLMVVAQAHNADLVTDNQVLFDSGANVAMRVGFEAMWDTRELTIYDMFSNDLADKSPLNFGNLKPVVRKSFCLVKGILYDEALRYGEDFLFTSQLILSGAKAMIVNFPGYIYSVRHGSLSNKKSAGSRTMPRFDQLVATSDDIVAQYGSMMNSDTLVAVKMRRRYLVTIHRSNVARELRKTHRLFSYATYLLRHPDVCILLANRLMHRASLFPRKPRFCLASDLAKQRS